MSEVPLHEVFTHPGVQAFGQALRFALRQAEDYASLVELEYVERREDFAEAIKKFLRRYESYARSRERESLPVFRPNQEHLNTLMALVDRPEVGVRPVRAALIAHALVRA